jgi:hypothetical protein
LNNAYGRKQNQYKKRKGEKQGAGEKKQRIHTERISNFSPQEYKQSPQNWCIAQDERGVMYFGNYGVLVYDGVSWRHVNIKDTAVRSLCIPPGQNKIYVGAQSNLGYLVPDAIGQLRFVSLLDSIPQAYRNFKDVWRTFAIGEAVYFQTFEYIFRWTGGKLSVWTPKHSFHRAFVINDKFYARQRERGLMQMVGDSLQMIPGGERFAQEPILMMLSYDASTILIGTLNQGLFLYDGTGFTPFATTADAFLRENQLSKPCRWEAWRNILIRNGKCRWLPATR